LIVVVFDTNVLVSAVLSPGRAASRALDLWYDGLVRIATTDEILSEYRTVLSRPKLRLITGNLRHFPEQHRDTRIVDARTCGVSE
jgi:putative PIN family toxin of toxin-antitoxin system